MIILSDQDSKDDSSYSGTTLRHPSLARTCSTATLPPYEQYAPSLVTTLSSAPVRKVKFYKNQRVWKIAGIAFAVYVALTLLIGLPIIIRSRSLDSDSLGSVGNPNSFLLVDNTGKTVGPLNGTISPPGYGVICNHWSDTGSQFLSANYTLRSSGGAVNIRSNSSQGFINPIYFNGSLHVSTNPDPDVRDPHFNVKIMGSDVATLRQLNLCFSNSSRDGGLAIYLPDALSGGWLQPSIQLVLPSSNVTDPTVVPTPYFTLNTYLPMFRQIYDLQGTKGLVSVNIEGGSAPITSNYLEAEDLVIINALAPISGDFRTHRSLSMQTTQGSIQGNITLYEDHIRYPVLTAVLTTQASPIDANIRIEAPSGKKSSSSLNTAVTVITRATTSNAALNLDVRDERLPGSTDATLRLQTRNSLQQTNVSLGPTFKGNFAVQTKMSNARVQDNVKDDPKGANRTRVFEIDKQINNHVNGYAGWKEKSITKPLSPQSEFDLASDLGPVHLKFED